MPWSLLYYTSFGHYLVKFYFKAVGLPHVQASLLEMIGCQSQLDCRTPCRRLTLTRRQSVEAASRALLSTTPTVLARQHNDLSGASKLEWLDISNLPHTC